MKYLITRNECSHAYAKVTYSVSANSKKEAIEKLADNEAKLESFEFESWSEDGSDWIDDKSEWEIQADEISD
ncbi:hypothetical protein GJV85_03545 [Sulfurimonas aquatica]|uniref:Uncharacterized protein n=1 Tax=Sulfurimonas aquatica TaxID=2672570 RepID=A0A975AZ27_9BACT|nr:hypothetical protein [Sulfurimonas aquatica]QSZ41224.1 hypothetical protein GJV85_03545 [Sulfurimonas aquatica]